MLCAASVIVVAGGVGVGKHLPCALSLNLSVWRGHALRSHRHWLTLHPISSLTSHVTLWSLPCGHAGHFLAPRSPQRRPVPLSMGRHWPRCSEPGYQYHEPPRLLLSVARGDPVISLKPLSHQDWQLNAILRQSLRLWLSCKIAFAAASPGVPRR